MENEKIIFII